MSDDPWDERFETVLRTHTALFNPNDPIAPDLDLTSHGLDSLAAVSLLLELEDEFKVMIPDEMLTATTFATPNDLWSVVAALMND